MRTATKRRLFGRKICRTGTRVTPSPPQTAVEGLLSTGTSYEDILELVGFVKECGAEEVFAEGVNPRGRGLILTAEALRDHGFDAEAVAVDRIRRKPARMEYIQRLVRNVQRAMRKHRVIRKLRFLLYRSDLTEEAEREIRKDAVGVIWL